FDHDTIQRALRALQTVPFFQEGATAAGGQIIAVGPPTGNACQVAGAWPSPESMVERIIAAFEATANDEDLPEPERTRAQRIWEGFKSGGSRSPSRRSEAPANTY